MIVIFLITAVAAVFDFPVILKGLGIESNFVRPYKFGLDIVGGSQLIYEVDMSEIESADRESVVGGLRDVIERRVNLFGVSEPRVVTSRSGESYRLIVELAGIRNISEAISEIKETPFLDFREVREKTALETEAEPEENTTSTDEKEPQFELVRTDLTGRYIKSAKLDFDQTTQEPLVFLEFDKDGAKLFEELTARNVNRPLPIFLDDEMISQPMVREKISGGRAQITGRFTLDEANTLVERFNAGALPAPIRLMSQQTVDATLGARALGVGLTAGVVGTFAVMIFMLVYYLRLGFFASVALVIYIVLTVAIFKLVPVTLTMAGIAGFILSIGMAVDANVLIFERTNEELRKGLGRSNAIEEGFRRAWPSIRDSNISTIITALVLYFFTTSIVKGFALTLLIGVLASMFSAITVTRTMLRVFIRK